MKDAVSPNGKSYTMNVPVTPSGKSSAIVYQIGCYARLSQWWPTMQITFILLLMCVLPTVCAWLIEFVPAYLFLPVWVFVWCWIQLLPLYSMYKQTFEKSSGFLPEREAFPSNKPHELLDAPMQASINRSITWKSRMYRAWMRIVEHSPTRYVWGTIGVALVGLGYMLYRVEDVQLRYILWNVYLQVFWLIWSVVIPKQYLWRIQRDQHWMLHDMRHVDEPVLYGKDAQHSMVHTMFTKNGQKQKGSQMAGQSTILYEHRSQLEYEQTASIEEDKAEKKDEQKKEPFANRPESPAKKVQNSQENLLESPCDVQTLHSLRVQVMEPNPTVDVIRLEDDLSVQCVPVPVPVSDPDSVPVSGPVSRSMMVPVYLVNQVFHRQQHQIMPTSLPTPIPIINDSNGNVYFNADKVMRHESIAVGMDVQHQTIQLVDVNSLPPAWACMFVSWSNTNRHSWWTLTMVTYIWLALYMWLNTLSSLVDLSIETRVINRDGVAVQFSGWVCIWIGVGLCIGYLWYRLVQQDAVLTAHSSLVFFRIHYIYLVMGTSTLAPFVVCWMMWNGVNWLRSWESVTIPSWIITVLFIVLSQLYWFVTQILVQNMSASGGYARFVMVCQIATKVFQYLIFGTIKWSAWFPVQVALAYAHNAWMTCGGYEWLRDVYSDWAWQSRQKKLKKQMKRLKQIKSIEAKQGEGQPAQPTQQEQQQQQQAAELHPLLRRWSALTKWERVLRVLSWKYNIDTFLQDVITDVSLLCLVIVARTVQNERFQLFFAGLSSDHLLEQWLTILIVDFVCVLWTWRWMRRRFMEEWACADVNPKTLSVALQRCKLPASIRTVIIEKLKRELPECFGTNLPICPIPWYKMAMHEIFQIDNLSPEEKRLPELERWYAWREHVVDSWCSFQQVRDYLSYYILVLFWCIGWMMYIQWLV